MGKDVINRNITTEMQNSFLDYSMSVIVARALPDVRDGLKPVHRRILFAMSELGNTPDKPYKKSARIVGDVIGKYHPHGDSSVYEAMVRMAQEFSYRLELVDGHGNFGSIDGDGAAAMRYTEARMSKVATELLTDINKNTIDFQDNYDGSEREPIVLPAKFPNILVNGASGIAVGMATSIPPHNLGEVIAATIALLENKDISIEELSEIVKGPDFPLGAQILGDIGIKKAYQTGNGSIKIRSKYDLVERSNGKSSIIFTEIPFQVNKAVLVEKIADCIKNKVVDGIADLRDESDRDGIRIVLELKKEANVEVIVNNLFKHTQLEVSFSMNMLALVKGRPHVLNLKEILFHYLEHQKEVLRRSTQFDLDKASRRAHILEGLKIATDNIDRVITIIRGSETVDKAKQNLQEEFALSDEQTKAILEMRLQKLTGLEREKIEAELQELNLLIEELKMILADENKINAIIKEDLQRISDKYSTPRRTEIISGYIESGTDYESLIEEKDTLITLTKSGYIKRISTDSIRVQNRGGKGTKGMGLHEDDEISQMIFTSTHSDLLFFTENGKVFKTRTYKIPEYNSRTAKGIPLLNLIDIEKNERITSIVSIKEYEENASLFFITRKGRGKRTSVEEFIRINKNGKRAITLEENDEVIEVEMVQPEEKVFFATKNGMSLKTEVSQFRMMGRTAKGVTALKFKEPTDEIIGFGVLSDEDNVITVTEQAFVKSTHASEYRIQSRAGKGTRNLKISDKTGLVEKITIVNNEEIEKYDLLILTQCGQSIRTSIGAIRSTGRNTQGVKFMKLPAGDKVNALELVESEIKEENKDEIIDNENNKVEGE